MSQRAFTYIELPLNQPKPSRKTRKNSQKNSLEEKKMEETLGGAIQWGIPSSRDGQWKTGAEHRLYIVTQQRSVNGCWNTKHQQRWCKGIQTWCQAARRHPVKLNVFDFLFCSQLSHICRFWGEESCRPHPFCGQRHSCTPKPNPSPLPWNKSGRGHVTKSLSRHTILLRTLAAGSQNHRDPRSQLPTASPMSLHQWIV